MSSLTRLTVRKLSIWGTLGIVLLIAMLLTASPKPTLEQRVEALEKWQLTQVTTYGMSLSQETDFRHYVELKKRVKALEDKLKDLRD